MLIDSLGFRIILFDSCIWVVGGFSVGAGFGVTRAHFLLFKIIHYKPGALLSCLLMFLGAVSTCFRGGNLMSTFCGGLGTQYHS